MLVGNFGVGWTVQYAMFKGVLIDNKCENLFVAALEARRSLRYQEAFSFFEEAAKGGNAQACFEVGHVYENGGLGVVQSDELAKCWFERGAQTGHGGCAATLSFMYDPPERDAPDNDEARLEWTQSSALRDKWALVVSCSPAVLPPS